MATIFMSSISVTIKFMAIIRIYFMDNRILSYVTFFILMLKVSMLQAASVLPLGLERLVDDAQIIFLGKCLSNTTEQELSSGFIVTYTTFQILEPIKGVASDTHTIKQIGGSLPESAIEYKVSGIPKFEIDKEYVIFLPPVSSHGFSSPVGLEQGRFNVMQNGVTEISNGRDVEALLKDVPENKIPTLVRVRLNTKFSRLTENAPDQERARQRMPLKDFMSILRSMEGQ